MSDFEKDLTLIDNDMITFFDRGNIVTVKQCEYKESHIPRVGDSVFMYHCDHIPMIKLTARPTLYIVTEIQREYYKNGVVHVWVYVERE